MFRFFFTRVPFDFIPTFDCERISKVQNRDLVVYRVVGYVLYSYERVDRIEVLQKLATSTFSYS